MFDFVINRLKQMPPPTLNALNGRRSILIFDGGWRTIRTNRLNANGSVGTERRATTMLQNLLRNDLRHVLESILSAPATGFDFIDL